MTWLSNHKYSTPNQDQTKAFIASFINIYKGHGGNVVNTQPAMTLGNEADPGASVTAAFQAAGNQSQARPQILIFVLPTKNTDMYLRIKKSTDCRYGMMSQCVQAAHVLKNQPQYHSNVCMKFNAKLGGTTNKVALVSYFRIHYVIDTDVGTERESTYARAFL